VNYIKTLILLLITFALGKFLNGDIAIPGIPLPPLAKFFNPAKGIWNNAEPAIFKDQNLKFSQLAGKAEVIYDERMVPHIYASNMADALFLQGYVEAEHRLFQMDFMTRAASGRLSEVMGLITLPFDKERLRSQIDTAASNAVIGWKKNPKEYALLEKYVAGVNAYIDQLKPEDYPYEYKLLNFKPEAWTTKKSALVYKSMADVLAGASFDLENSNSLALLGQTMFNQLYPENEDGGYPVIPYEKKYDYKNPQSLNPNDSAIAKTYFKQFYKNRDHGVGSNNWAVSGSKTKNKAPLFCNDPHLGLTLPSIWIEEHISIPETNVYGVSFPGFPGIMIGFNDHIAWGETNVGQDIEDMFEIKWADKKRTKYICDGKEVATKMVVKEIKIKNMQSVYDTLYYTNHGIVKLMSKDAKSDIAVRWLAVDEQKEAEFMTFVNIMQAKNYEDFKKGLAIFNTPAQNFLFASKSGDIALHVNGKLPIRQKEDGRFIESGALSSTDWDQYIPREQNPFILNPKAGYLNSSNQRSAGSDFPYYYTGKFEHFRNRVVNDTLSRKTNLDIEDMKKLQSNNLNMIAFNSLPYILASLKKQNVSNPILDQLSKWDCKYIASSTNPTVFESLFQNIYDNTFEEILMYKDTLDILQPEDWRLVNLISKDVKSSLWDNVKTKNKIETVDDIILQSYNETIDKSNSENLVKSWGIKRPVSINHYTRIPAFSSTNLAVNGTPDAVNAVNSNFGPSWRMIVSLDKETEAYGIFPGGQSGNPLSKFYKNMIPDWIDNKYYKLNATKDRSTLKSIKKITIN
jgi:penicillin G amidase